MSNKSRDKYISRVKKNTIRFVVYLLVWMGIAILYYLIFSAFFDTPIEHEVRKVNQELSLEYERAKARYDSLELVLDNVIERDKNVYTILFESDPYQEDSSEDYILSLVDISNNELADIFFKKLSQLDRSIASGTIAFDTLQRNMVSKGVKVLNMPSIQPVTNKELTRLAASYGMRIHPFYRTMKSHQGVDYAVSENTRVYATADGRVKEVSSVSRSSGLSVTIDHGNGYETVYSHLNKSLVRRGQKVSRGDIIAYSGNSGLSFMPHLHYEVVYKGVRQDPINYFYQELSPYEYSRIIDIAHIGMQSLD